MSESLTQRRGMGLSPAGYLRLALRNLWRNPRRTGLTLFSMVLGVAALTLLGALNDGWLRQMQDNFILALTGHVQIHARGFEDSQRLERRIRDLEPVLKAVEQDTLVTGWTRRIRTSGLASLGAVSAGVQLMAVDPEQETWVTHMHAGLSRGEWLKPGLSRDLLLGATVAKNLGAALGDKLVLTVQAPDGRMLAEVFLLKGVLTTGAPQIDRGLALVNLGALQAWMGLGESVTDIVLRVESHDQSAALRDRLAEALSGLDLEVMSWRSLDPMVSQWLDFSDAYGLVLIFVVAALVLVEVLNAMLMAVHERGRELAIMSALGTRPGQLFLLVLLESVMLIVLGALAGYLLGAIGVIWLAPGGIDLSTYANAFRFFYMSPLIHPLLTLDSALRILGSTLVAALLAGLYPAWRAAGACFGKSAGRM